MPGPAWYVARNKHDYLKVISFSGICPISSCPCINGIIQGQVELTIRGPSKEASLFLTEENLEVFHVPVEDESLSLEPLQGTSWILVQRKWPDMSQLRYIYGLILQPVDNNR